MIRANQPTWNSSDAGCDSRTASLQDCFVKSSPVPLPAYAQVGNGTEVVLVEQGVMWQIEYAHILLTEIEGRLGEMTDKLHLILNPSQPGPAEGSVKANRSVSCPASEQLYALHSRLHQMIDGIGALTRRVAL